MRDPESSLPILKTKAQEALDLAAAGIQQPSPTVDNAFTFMTFAYLGKQTEHMRGILTLVAAGLCRDAGLIARSMLEGRAQLRWASAKPEERAPQWQDFWPVSDWRKMNKELKAGQSVSPALQAKIQQALSAHGDRFLRDSGCQRQGNGLTLRSKDYWENWTGHPYSELLDLCVSAPGEVPVPEHALKLLTYSPLSAWHHWDIGGFKEAVPVAEKIAGGTVTYAYTQPGSRPCAEALAVGFQCLFVTLDIANDPLGLGIGEKLENLFSDYCGALGENGTNIRL